MLEPSSPELQGLQTADLCRQVSSEPMDIERLTPNHLASTTGDNFKTCLTYSGSVG